MKANREASDEKLMRIEALFRKTMSYVISTLGDRTFRPDRSLNTAVFDAVSTAIAERIEKNGLPEAENTIKAYDALFQNERFVAGYIQSTADEENVKKRMEEARLAFSKI